jgi:hypothetical protein
MGGRSQERVQGLHCVLLVPDILCVSSEGIIGIFLWRLLIMMSRADLQPDELQSDTASSDNGDTRPAKQRSI